MWSSIPQILQTLALLAGSQATVYQNVSQRYGTARHRTSHQDWIRATRHQIEDAPEVEEIPELTDLDELQNYLEAGDLLDEFLDHFLSVKF
ncbi:MAG: hypothetical protein ACRC8A_02890 [Microcoleaceae cyanobacterium]